MVRSMTAFARGRATENGLTASVEMKSVNHRYLEIGVRLPRSHGMLEEKIKGVVKDLAVRGRVDVSVDLGRESGKTAVYTVDAELARAYHGALCKLAEELSLEGAPSLSLFARTDGIIVKQTSELDPEEDWPVILAALRQAGESFLAMRGIEGEALEADFRKRLDYLAEKTEEIAGLAAGIPEKIKERFTARLTQLMAEAGEPDPVRIAQEAALYADKADITEELVRVRSHLAQFAALLAKEEPCGRPLNFLVQELFREFSTMGAKSVDASLSHLALDAKTEVEKLREQIQNVE
ncbi:MAG: YicC/YloC family endoribonuclease [Thermodesulfobacteriota bacterium]